MQGSNTASENDSCQAIPSEQDQLPFGGKRAGFRQSIRDVRDLAGRILQKRDSASTVNPQWIQMSLQTPSRGES